MTHEPACKPNKPMASTAPTSLDENPLVPLRWHIGQSFGSLGEPRWFDLSSFLRGGLRCAGCRRSEGQLGDGMMMNRMTPVEVVGLPLP